jgi:hypothetical protein
MAPHFGLNKAKLSGSSDYSVENNLHGKFLNPPNPLFQRGNGSISPFSKGGKGDLRLTPDLFPHFTLKNQLSLEYLRSRLSSVDLWLLIFGFVVFLYVLPIWVFKYFPSQDGPCHIYNSFILRHYNDSNYRFDQFYEINKRLIPNWTSHAFMMLLMYIIPPLIAEKILLTVYIILMAVGMLYLLNAVGKDRTPLVFIGLPLIYNYLLLMGFYNFVISVALFIISIGYWYKHFQTFNVKNTVILAILLVILYFCHAVSLALAIFSIVVMAILSLISSKDKQELVKGFLSRIRWKQVLLSFISMLPAIGLLLYYTKGNSVSDPGGWTLKQLWQYFIRNESLSYYNQSQIIFGKLVTGAFISLFFYTLIRDHLFTKEWKFGLRIEKKDLFLLLCIAFFVIYLKAPDGMSGGGFIKTRMSLFPFLIIIPWLSWNMPKVAKGIIGTALIILSVAYIVHASYYHRMLSDDMKVYTSGYDVVEKNKVVMPLAFNSAGRCLRIGMFLHSVGHYGYETGCIEMDNYEATTDYFPTFYKPSLHRPDTGIIEGKPGEVDFAEYAKDIDYIITWALESKSDAEAKIMKYYSLIKQNGDLKVFVRKSKI